MLPGAAYTSEAVLAWERRHLFAGSWTCLGRTAELSTGGNQHALTVGDLAVIVTLAPQPRAFANVCRHRAHSLLPVGTSCDRPAIVCPYHGWAYTLDGSLRSAPRMESLPAGHGLVELPCVDWHGWLFVNALGTGESFGSHLGTLDRLVAPYDPAALVPMARHCYEVAANWKILAENYHECYHCPLIHPELCAVSPPNSGNNWHEPGNWVGGSMDLREHAVTMSRDGKSHGVMLDGVDPRSVRYLGLFPNLLVSLHPDYVMTHRLEPVSPALTRVECEWLFHPSTVDIAYAVDFWDLTNKQDWAACESVQLGVSSPHYRPGPLAPNENAVYDWIRLIATAYTAQR
ncbi:(2Fe-2S)-binding protein [Rhizocola hellebori]|uniref:(2Fe-2S)-binding protein n=2 Tax=Rhizocola hellebori TaxID=1392758 RepID=A0A8J3VKM9_9ACTN|nr:(2Fe-2S)-binding protein [Rhizocola hellebori]